jgi:NDP-sugar pyrophosphorylase family protein
MVRYPQSTDRNLSVSGIILAGTFPWSNSAFDRLWARPLIPIAHRPLLSYALSWLRGASVDNVIVCGNRDTRAVEPELMNRLSKELNFSYLEDPMPRGAAGCVRDAGLSCESDTLVVTDGAAIPTVDLDRLLENHQQSGAVATVVVYSEARRGGHPSRHTPAGVYVFDRAVIESIPRKGFCDIKEHLIPRLVRAGERVMTYDGGGAIPRVLNEETYLAVNDFVIERLASGDNEREGYQRKGEALIHSEASVAEDAILVGPLLVGPGATISSRAVLIGPTSLGCDATIGPGALVSRSAVWRRSTIQADAAIDRTIVADDVVIERGRHEHRMVVAGRPHERILQRADRPRASSKPPAAGRPEPLLGSLG